jgi:uncharacterized protein (DUF885 family)
VRAKRILKWTGGVLAVLVLVAAGLFVQVWYFRPFSSDIFFERVFIQLLLKEPEFLSDLGVLHQLGYRGLDDELTDESPAHTDEITRLAKSDLEQLHGYNRASLSQSQQLSYDVLDWYLTDEVEGRAWAYHTYPVNQMDGVQSATPEFIVRVHPIADAEDARNYNKRLVAFGPKFAGLLEGLKLRESKGVVPPKFVIQRVLAEMRAFVATPARQNVLYTNLRDKLARLDSVPADEQAKLLSDASTAIEKQVYPAYAQLITFFEHLDSTVQDEFGVWKLPDGDKYYDYLVRHHTSTSMTAEAVHQFGLSEVTRIEQAMDAILREQGLTEGTIGARMTTLSTQPRVLYSNDDAGRKQCLADYQRIMDEMIRGLPPAFAAVPRLNVRVERVPVFKEGGSAAAYANSGSLDGSRPGTFYVNLRDMNEQQKFTMRTVTYHEGVPGHLLQGAFSNSLEGVPTFRKALPFTAYDEGWGLYAEQLAYELGYEKDPLDNLGRLQYEMLRAVRLVVDTGIHRKHWTHDQAIDYMVEKTGRPRSDAVSEVERYFVLPGQALAYKVGMQKILDLRAGAQQRLGDKFDIREFHSVVLTNGALPLGTHEAQVNAWVERRAR